MDKSADLMHKISPRSGFMSRRISPQKRANRRARDTTVAAPVTSIRNLANNASFVRNIDNNAYFHPFSVIYDQLQSFSFAIVTNQDKMTTCNCL